MNTNIATTRVRRSLAALAVLSGIALADTAAPGELSNEPLTAAVSYADLNLGNAAGAAAMYRRLDRAARRVCAPLDGRRGLKAPWRECVNRAIASAVEQVDAPMLTAHHLAKQRKIDTRVASAN